jgi:hypothetical protein
MSEFLEQERNRGQKAREILDNPIWKEAVSQINQSLLEKMGNHYDDPTACQVIALTKRIHDDYQEYFEAIAESGKLAAYELNQ